MYAVVHIWSPQCGNLDAKVIVKWAWAIKYKPILIIILVVFDQMELIPDPDPDEEGTKISVSMWSVFCTLHTASPSRPSERVYAVILYMWTIPVSQYRALIFNPVRIFVLFC